MEKVSFFTKYYSNKNYINEIAIEEKHTSKFYFQLGYYDQYVAQVIRSGNALSLLSNQIVLNRENFWNLHYFEDIVRFIFWTFNKSFLLILKQKIETLDTITAGRCIQLLQQHTEPYTLSFIYEADEELYWCTVKNAHLKNDSKFDKMYQLDKVNRHLLLEALLKEVNENKIIADEKKKEEMVSPVLTLPTKESTFIDILEPINGSSEETLQFIISHSIAAGLDFDIFALIIKLDNGKNPYGLNSCIGAVIDYFYQLGYFKKAYELETIFMAYCSYSGNQIGKMKIFLSEFRQDKRYQKNTSKLKLLKINKLR